MKFLVPSASERERMGICLAAALLIHAVLVFGLAFPLSPAASAPDFEVLWAEGADGAVFEEGAQKGAPWPARQPQASRGGRAQAQEAYTLEQEYTRRWVERTERLGEGAAQNLNGEVVVHVMLDARGMVRQVEVEPGPDSLTRAAHRIVLQSQPHPPFPQALRAHRDRLLISRRWLFGDSVQIQASEPLAP